MNFFDKLIYDIVFNLHSTFSTMTFTFISYFGSAIALILITIGILIFDKGKKNSRYIAFNLLASYLISQILKLIFRRPRPEVLRLAVEKGYSLPSGHAMVSIVYYGFFIFLILQKIKDSKKKKIYSVLLFLLIFIIGISRVYLGVHYATDIIAGHIFGLIYLIISIKYIYNGKESRLKKLLIDKS